MQSQKDNCRFYLKMYFDGFYGAVREVKAQRVVLKILSKEWENEMTEDKIELATGLCVVALTRYIAVNADTSYKDAFIKLLTTELFDLLMDSGTGLYLEPNEFLFEAYDVEQQFGKEALGEFFCG